MTSIYFVTTTSTTVGYGDFDYKNNNEKTYAIFSEIMAICIFSIISGRISSLNYSKSIQQIVKEKENEI